VIIFLKTLKISVFAIIAVFPLRDRNYNIRLHDVAVIILFILKSKIRKLKSKYLLPKLHPVTCTSVTTRGPKEMIIN